MKHLSGLDNLFLAVEHGNQLMQVAALGIYDPSTAPGGELRFTSVLAFFESRMKQTKIFRRRLVEAPWGLDRPYWIDDTDVDVEYHVRHIALPQPGDWRQLMIQVARLHSRSLDKSKPLWEAYIIEGLDHVPGIAPGSFALYIKFHHAAVDGQGGVEIIRAIHSLSPTLDPEEDEDVSQVAIVADRNPTTVELCARAVSHRACQLLDGARLIADLGKRAAAAGIGLVASGKAMDISRKVIARRLGVAEMAAEMTASFSEILHVRPHTRFDGKISAHRVVDVAGLSLADCNRIRQQVEGVTINDIFMATAGGALRKYLELKGELPAASLNAMMPISTRSGHTAGDEGNQVAMAAVPLATDIADPLQRLLAVRRATGRGKSISAALGKDLPARLIEVLPAMVVEHVARLVLVPLVNVTISNVHGPDEALYMAGAKLQMFTPISIAIDGVGLNLTGLSYNGTLWVCFVSCRKMLPDPGVFVKCLTESFNELLAATVGKPEPQAETRPAARRTTVTSRSVRSKAVPVDNKNDAMVTTTVELPVARKQVSRGPRAKKPELPGSIAVENAVEQRPAVKKAQ
ncbi:MAG TPA: wax ester/triacylglycerol synthase family O-acyltransferase [Azonexus sp.]|nr:wax ester/triacylglycerol synthase family O-acyltransferase [Azonexus sp.]